MEEQKFLVRAASAAAATGVSQAASVAVARSGGVARVAVGAAALATEFDPEDEYLPEPEAAPLPPAWLDGSVRVGIHTSIAGGHRNALEVARKLGCNALQIFSANPRQWESGPARIPEVEAAAFRARRAELGLGPLVVHANYLINLASPQPMLRVRSIQAFHDEIVRSIALGADFLVVHPGTRGEATCAQAVSTVVESVKQAAKRNALGGLRILLENTAGMGSCLSSRLEEMAEILARLGGFPVGVCLDTAHLFAAGYELRTSEGLEETIAAIESTVGLENVPVFHVNDSKIALGGRVDRHDHLGRGKIGGEAFSRLLRHPRLIKVAGDGSAGRAFIAETPIDDPGDDRRNVAALWELAGLKDVAPAAEKGFSMLTPALKKKMVARVAAEKKAAGAAVAAVARKKATTARENNERFVHTESLRNEAEKQRKRLAPVGATELFTGSKSSEVVSIATKLLDGRVVGKSSGAITKQSKGIARVAKNRAAKPGGRNDKATATKKRK